MRQESTTESPSFLSCAPRKGNVPSLQSTFYSDDAVHWVNSAACSSGSGFEADRELVLFLKQSIYDTLEDELYPFNDPVPIMTIR
jgi:hypothetical protein